MKGAKTIVIEVCPGEVRGAVLDPDDRPLQFLVERTQNRSLVDSVYLGRVLAVRDNLGAAFVDLGVGSDGYLNIKDTDRDAAGTRIVEGASILVRVTRDGGESKGPMLSTSLDFAGTSVVLTPGTNGIGISRRITEDDERARLRGVLETCVPDGVGSVARTNAAGLAAEDLEVEVSDLAKAWQEMADSVGNLSAPALIKSAAGLAERIVRDFAGEDTEGILIDDADELSALKKAFPASGGLISLVKSGAFAVAEIENSFDAAMQPNVPLAGGGSLIISETPAMATIDVNAGRGASGNAERLALETNLEAARAIARELRLRGIGGLVAIDFLRMKETGNKEKVLAALKKAFAHDPANPRVGPFSPFGLVDVVRRRDGVSLAQTFFSAALRKTPETVALEALQAVKLNAGSQATLQVAPDVAGQLTGALRAELDALGNRLGFDIQVEAVTSQDPETFVIT